jgi:hypothetical protein
MYGESIIRRFHKKKVNSETKFKKRVDKKAIKINKTEKQFKDYFNIQNIEN